MKGLLFALCAIAITGCLSVTGPGEGSSSGYSGGGSGGGGNVRHTCDIKLYFCTGIICVRDSTRSCISRVLCMEPVCLPEERCGRTHVD